MIDLRDLYQDIILDHGRHPRNFRPIEHPTHTARGHNPLCGDRVTIYLTLDGDKYRVPEHALHGRPITTAELWDERVRAISTELRLGAYAEGVQKWCPREDELAIFRRYIDFDKLLPCGLTALGQACGLRLQAPDC